MIYAALHKSFRFEADRT